MSSLLAKTFIVGPHRLPCQERNGHGSREVGVSDDLLHQAGGGTRVSDSLILVDEEEFQTGWRYLGERGVHAVDVQSGGVDEGPANCMGSK